MRHRALAAALSLAPLALAPLVLALLGGCVMPARGTPVFVDMRAGDFWSGDGKLIEVSEDKQRCLVLLRSSSLVVGEHWVDCAFVHATRVQDQEGHAPASSFQPSTTRIP